MKITFLLLTADAVGGTERAVFNQAAELVANHDVRVLSILKTQPQLFFPIDERIRVDYLIDQTGPTPVPTRATTLAPEAWAQVADRPSSLVDPSWEAAFNRLTDLELEYALEHTDTELLITTTPALMALAVQLAPAHVMTLHQEHRVSELRGPSAEPLLRYASRLDALAVLSNRTRDWFAETLGGSAPRIDVVPNALPRGFRPRSTLETRSVVIAGRLVGEKQIDHAIAIWDLVARVHPTWTLRVFGDGPLAGTLRRQIDVLGLHDCVQLNGNSPHLAEEWAKASIALMTSRNEAFPLVLTEAQAAGVPVVSYDCPNGPREVILDGRTGILVPADDIGAAAQAVIRLIEDPSLRHHMGMEAARSVERLAPPVVTSKWEKIFAELDAERSSGARAARRAERQAVHSLMSGQEGMLRPAAPAPATTVATKEQRTLEERLLRADRDLVRDGGQLCRWMESESPWDVVQHNLALTANALEYAQIPYFVTRDTNVRHAVAVHTSYREAVFKALSAVHGASAVYVALLNEQQKPTATVLAAFVERYAEQPCSAVRLYQNAVSRSRTLRLAGVYGCTINFWEGDPDSPQTMVSPVRTMVGDRIPTSALRLHNMVLGGRTYPTVEAFAHTLHGDVTFPIDAVYTWVNGGDVNWLERKHAVMRALGMYTEDSASSAARFRNRDELRYSLRSIDMYAPWIRTIHIVTDQQVPDWLDLRHPRIRIVDHREIFADPSMLPTYNSHAIESQLHHIDGLSEHFLYFNDDVFVGRVLQPSMFFHGNGVAKHFMSPTTVPMGPVTAEDEFNMSAAKNNRDLVARTFGQMLAHSFLHAPHPLRRSVLADIEQHFPEAVAATAAARFRSYSDLAIASSLHHYVGYHTQRSAPGSINCGFVNVGLSEHKQRLARIQLGRPHDVFCLNDFHDGDVSEDEQDAVLAAFLPSYFPVASQFEAGSVRNQRFHAGYLAGWPL